MKTNRTGNGHAGKTERRTVIQLECGTVRLGEVDREQAILKKGRSKRK